jgi:hypothetical protein
MVEQEDVSIIRAIVAWLSALSPPAIIYFLSACCPTPLPPLLLSELRLIATL